MPTLSSGANTGPNYREANTILLKSISMRGILYFPASNPDSWNNIRIIIFQWKPNDGADSPTTAEILQLSQQPGAGALFNMLAPYQMDNSWRYRILSDKIYKPVYGGPLIGAATTGLGAGKPDIYFKHRFTKFPCGRAMQFTSSAAVTCENNVWILMISDSLVPGYPVLQYSVKMSFVDAS